MNGFISKLDQSVDLSRVINEIRSLLDFKIGWEPENQIGLRHRAGSEHPWKDSVGGLWERERNVRMASESDFSVWHQDCPTYTKQVLEELAAKEKINWGRVRFMRSLPKTGLSMHTDDEPRYHLVLWTNPSAIFGECYKNNVIRSICYHIPADSYWYKVDTTREHFVYNGGWSPRVHLVACPCI